MTIANGKKGSEEAEPGEDESEAEAVTCRPGKRGGHMDLQRDFASGLLLKTKFRFDPSPLGV